MFVDFRIYKNPCKFAQRTLIEVFGLNEIQGSLNIRNGNLRQAGLVYQCKQHQDFTILNTLDQNKPFLKIFLNTTSHFQQW